MDAPMGKEERKEPSLAKLSDTPFFFSFFGSNFYGRFSGLFVPPESPSLLARKSKEKKRKGRKKERKIVRFSFRTTVKSTLVICRTRARLYVVDDTSLSYYCR